MEVVKGRETQFAEVRGWGWERDVMGEDERFKVVERKNRKRGCGGRLGKGVEIVGGEGGSAEGAAGWGDAGGRRGWRCC